MGRRTEDGFDGFEVVEDLYDVTGRINAAVTLAEPGRTVLSYDFGVDEGGAGPTGLAFAAVRGYAGYAVDVAPVEEESCYYPTLSRSEDGDVITFDFTFAGTDPAGLTEFGDDPLDSVIETILLATDAPTFRQDGGGAVGVYVGTFGSEGEAVEVPPRLVAPAPIPLPAALPMLLAGLGALLALRRRA